VPEDSDEKPRTASLFSSMSPETVTLEDALRLLTLPRTLDAPDGEEILVANGRYGPYIKKGSESRSLGSEEQIFTLTVEEALALLAQPKQRSRRAAAAPLRELGPDPASDKPILVKDGRFGPYVTDGETNASLRTGDTVEGLTLERASELLAERRSRGPAKRRKQRKR
jgi:DNA topoisomerase-1